MPVIQPKLPRIYDGEGDQLMQQEARSERIILTPDSLPSKVPDATPRIRIMWGQHLLEDLLSGRYRTLVCAVNCVDNSRGIISQLAALLPTSQWDRDSITTYCKQFAGGDRVKVLKYDMDAVEVLAVARPASRDHLTIEDLEQAFRIVSEMIDNRSSRYPSASVSFLDAAANALRGRSGDEPSFETVIRTMYESGYRGDVYPSPSMWNASSIMLYPRYPFSPALEQMRGGGF